MSRKGSILIIDDLEQWREETAEILQHEGYHADVAPTIARALEMLQEAIYHILIVDFRMNEADQSNEEGIDLLEELERLGLMDSVQIIMLSAYGTKELTRKAFKEYAVADFLYKEDFSKSALLDSVRNVFADKVKINLTLEIHWQAGSSLEQEVRYLEIERAKGMHSAPSQNQLAAELDDLLCRLFDKAKSIMVRPLKEGRSGTGIMRVQPFFPAGGQAVVVKFGDFHVVKQEYENFKQRVEPFMGGGRTATIREVRRTGHLGGIIYSLLGTTHDQIVDFGEFYRQASIPQIQQAIEHLFWDTCGTWYASRGDPQPLDLAKDYGRLFGYNLDALEQVLSQQLSGVSLGTHTLSFTTLKGKRRHSFPNPIPIISGQPEFTWATYTCITHGDFNLHNLLVDSTGHIWLIDFQATAPSHILRDVAILDSVVRFQLLGSEDASLDQRLEMEEALCSIESFGEVNRLATAFDTQNPALEKAYAVTVYLRTLASRLVEMNPEANISEYYVALMYVALYTLQFSSLYPVQREHALLCSSLLIEHIERIEEMSSPNA